MQVRSFLLTLGLGMAAGGTVALMLPRQSGVRREAQKAADAVEQTITDAVQKLKPDGLMLRRTSAAFFFAACSRTCGNGKTML